MGDPNWESFRRDYLVHKEMMKETRMSKVNDLDSMIDNLKAELFPRFKHLLQSIAALEARICDLEKRVEK